MGASKSSFWSKDFNARSYLDDLKSVKSFDSKSERVQYLQDLAKFTHKDEQFLENITELANLMRREGLVDSSDLRRIFVKQDFVHAKFIWSNSESLLKATLSLDPAKVNAIEGLIIEAKLGKDFAKEYRTILRSSELSYHDLKFASQYGMRLHESKEALETFRQYIEFLDGYTGKKFGRAKIRTGLKNIENIYGKYDPKSLDVQKWFKPHKKFLANSPESISREEAIQNIVRDSNLPHEMRNKYREALSNSGLDHEQIEFAHKNGMILRADEASFERFKEYLVYLDYLPEYRVRKGLKQFEKIYKYTDDSRFFIPAEALPPHKQFMAQRNKALKYEQKRFQALEREFKMEERDKLMKELDEILEAKNRGLAIDESRIKEITAELDDTVLSKAQIKRVSARARAEGNIFRKLLNGCNGGGGARLASAKKKFKRFKLALSIGGTPLFYLKANWDKKDSDPYFWERLGQEMALGIFFTVVANKIVTNTNKGFWARYLEGYAKFAALDILNAGSYELMFGPKGYARYLQKMYNGGKFEKNQAELELEKLKNSPTFEKDVEELMSYLEEKSKDKNFKNLLDEHLNLYTYSSLDDEFKITQEDLETEEAREVMLELLAERMYLQNMGEWPVFQSGNSGLDRWAFYRARNVVMDIKSMAMNIAMFEIMCREPLGPIASWGLVVGIQLADWFVIGDLTTAKRREAINQ